MNTALAVNTGNAVPLVASLVQDIPLHRIRESKTNPRRQFDEVKLADNIRQHGVLQPVLVRPIPDGEPETLRTRGRSAKVPRFETRKTGSDSRERP